MSVCLSPGAAAFLLSVFHCTREVRGFDVPISNECVNEENRQHARDRNRPHQEHSDHHRAQEREDDPIRDLSTSAERLERLRLTVGTFKPAKAQERPADVSPILVPALSIVNHNSLRWSRRGASKGRLGMVVVKMRAPALVVHVKRLVAFRARRAVEQRDDTAAALGAGSSNHLSVVHGGH